MKRILTLVAFTAILFPCTVVQPVGAQEIVFSEDFESGSADGSWGQYIDGEETVAAVEMSSAPEPLATGGSYVGLLQDFDGSYTGAAIALAGDPETMDYSIEADVYCYVNHPGGSAYTGLVVYADAGSGTYVKLAADFDADRRLRLYNSRLNTSTFEYTFHHAFTAGAVPGGIPAADGWHHMKVEVRTLNADTTAYWCYFDGELLDGSPVYDVGSDRVSAGQFGLFSFQQSGDGIPAFFDNIVVKSLVPSSSVDDNPVTPTGSMLLQNRPNPFAGETRVAYRLSTGGYVTLTVHDLFGRVVRTLVAGQVEAGEYTATWRGDDDLGSPVPAGAYFYRLSSCNAVLGRQMMLAR